MHEASVPCSTAQPRDHIKTTLLLLQGSFQLIKYHCIFQLGAVIIDLVA